MKRIVKSIFTVCLFFIPMASECNTVAYSPSIPGQPLIFHKNSHFSYEKKIASELSSENRRHFFRLSKWSKRLSEELLGLVVNTPNNTAINVAIEKISRTFLKLEGSSSKQLALLVEQTLTNLTLITNEMVVNQSEFQQMYLEMQQQVINFYTVGLKDILSKSARHSVFKADAQSALEGLVSCLTLSILNTDSLVDDASSGQNNLVLARHQINKNLTKFVEATFALQAGPNKSE